MDSDFLTQDVNLTASSFEELQAQIDRLPYYILSNVTITLPGTKEVPVTVSTATVPQVDFSKYIHADKAFTITADAGAFSGPLAVVNGGTTFVTILKGTVPTWNAGDWAGATFLVLGQTANVKAANVGAVRTVDGAGITESNAAGAAGTTHWKVTVTSAFPATFAGVGATIYFALCACTVVNTYATNPKFISAVLDGPGTLFVTNICSKTAMSVTGRGMAEFNNFAIADPTGSAFAALSMGAWSNLRSTGLCILGSASWAIIGSAYSFTGLVTGCHICKNGMGVFAANSADCCSADIRSNFLEENQRCVQLNGSSFVLFSGNSVGGSAANAGLLSITNNATARNSGNTNVGTFGVTTATTNGGIIVA